MPNDGPGKTTTGDAYRRPLSHANNQFWLKGSLGGQLQDNKDYTIQGAGRDCQCREGNCRASRASLLDAVMFVAGKTYLCDKSSEAETVFRLTFDSGSRIVAMFSFVIFKSNSRSEER